MFSSCKVKSFYYLNKFFRVFFSKKIFTNVNMRYYCSLSEGYSLEKTLFGCAKAYIAYVSSAFCLAFEGFCGEGNLSIGGVVILVFHGRFEADFVALIQEVFIQIKDKTLAISLGDRGSSDGIYLFLFLTLEAEPLL